MTKPFRQHRSIARLVLASLAVGTIATTASAGAPPPNGAISCSVFSDQNAGQPKGLLFHPFINAVPRTVKLAGTNVGSACDNTDVTGGKLPITGVQIKFTARMADGTCGTLTSAAPVFENARIKFKWRGLNPANHYVTVSNGWARIATASYDTGTHALNLTTEPITGRAFEGKTATVHLTFDNPPSSDFEAGCGPTGGYLATSFGNDAPATIDVE